MRINLNAQMDPDLPEAQKFYLPHQVPDGVNSRAKAKGEKLTDLFELHEIKTINRDAVTFAEPIHLDIKALTLVPFYRVLKGGGEAPVLPGSAVLQHRNKKHPVNEMEVSYRKELFNFYRSYGKASFKPVIDQKQYIDLTRPFFDGNTEIPVKQLYHYIDSMVQAGFDKSQPVSRVDIHWKNAVPSNKVRLEIQTSNDPNDPLA